MFNHGMHQVENPFWLVNWISEVKELLAEVPVQNTCNLPRELIKN